MFIDPSSQIGRPTSTISSTPTTTSLIGKRTLADFQNQSPQILHQHHNMNMNMNMSMSMKNLSPTAINSLLRSVKPRIMYPHHHQQQQTSPISTLSPIELSNNSGMSNINMLSHRFGGTIPPLLQQLRPHPTPNLPSLMKPAIPGGVASYMHALQQQSRQDLEKKNIISNRLLELEKHLLDDVDEENDAVSVITNNNNSEWTETMNSLINSSSGGGGSSESNNNQNLTQANNTNNPISPSSSSSSSSVTTPVTKQTILDVALAMSEGKTEAALEILARVSQVSNPRGSSEQRLFDYMVKALRSRLSPVENPPPVLELYSADHDSSTYSLYELSPCFKLGFIAANLAIVEATAEELKAERGFHVIDFDIGQGGQYVNLLHALSGKSSGVVKITAVADGGGEEEKQRLGLIGDRLGRLAGQFSVTLKFNVVNCKIADLSRDSLGCDPDECLVVNFAFKLYKLPDESVSMENPRDELLRHVKGLSPRLVTLVEQEINTNTAPFMARVSEGCAYYSALFDSFELTVLKDSEERVKAEQGLGRKLANSLACEGRERVERCEVFGKWRARMGMAGFELIRMSQAVADSMREKLGSGNRANPGFTVKEETGGVCFGWKGKTLTVASAWR